MRPLDLAEWVDDLPDYEAQLVEKRRVLDECDDVVAALPGTEASQAEVLRRLANHVAKRFPERYERQPDEPGDNLAHQLGVNGPDGDLAPVEPTVSCSDAPEQRQQSDLADLHALRVRCTGERVDLASVGRPAIESAGRLVPEDLCLMRADEGGHYRLVAAALAFPTRWRLADKIGKPMLAIHAPVPGYAASIGKATDAMMSRLRVDRPLWRQNWSIVDAPDLYQPQRPPPGAQLLDSALPDRLWVRTERQTLRRMPDSGDVLFTIRIRQVTVTQLCEIPGAGGRLLLQLNTMPDGLRAYKRIGEVDEELQQFLRQYTIDG